MGSFPRELDVVVGRRMKEFGRTLTRQESEVAEAELFQRWVNAGRYDELIRRIHAVYDREGGHEECVVLGHALQQAGDVERIEALFQGLIKRRVKAFWSNWELAKSGHPGHMLGCAKQSASAMETYLEYYIRVANLGLEERKEQLRQEMLAFQARDGVVGASASRNKAPNNSFKPKPLRGSA